MRKTYFLFTLLCLSLLGCDTEEHDPGHFEFLPKPQQYSINGVSSIGVENIQTYYLEGSELSSLEPKILADLDVVDQMEEADIVCKMDTSLNIPSEGYHLQVLDQKIEITGKDEAGLFYGLQTLFQLVEDAGEQETNLPLIEVEDFPKLPYRAIHIDVKHHMEKKDYYFRLMDELAYYKINGIILEIEDKLRYERQPEVASPDALTIEEWGEIADYALARNIRISPLVQGLGHASFILKHEAYQHLRDDPESDWAFNPLLPETYNVQFDLYQDALAAFPHGKYLHVGGDEVHTTGGNSGRSPLELQLIWLDKVCDFASTQGRVPIFWDDMPLKHAGVYRMMFNPSLPASVVDSTWAVQEAELLKFLDRFPQNCIYMRWNYSTPETYGNRKAMSWFQENGLQVMGATAGQTRFVLMPQKESNMDAIRAFANIAIENKAPGLLLTLWDDDSPHFELYKRGIAAFAEYTWTGDQRSKQAIKSAYRQRAFSVTLADTTYAFIDDLEGPVGFWKNAFLEGNRRNYLRSMEAPTTGLITFPAADQQGAWTTKYADRLNLVDSLLEVNQRISDQIAHYKTLTNRNGYRIEVYEQVKNISAYPLKVLRQLKAYDSATTEEEKSAAMTALDELRKDFAGIRLALEEVYGKTRILNKPQGYILDQDHHVHLANQSKSFDWQFHADELFLAELDNWMDSTFKK